MAKFKIGDEVLAIGEVGGLNLAGWEGHIIIIRNDDYGVEFGNSLPDSRGHDCEGRGKNGFCRWCDEEEIEMAIDMRESILK